MLYLVPPYGGYHYRWTVTATAGNSNKSWSPAAGKRGYLLDARLTLVADATVASRKIRIYKQVTTGPVTLGATIIGPATAAGETKVLGVDGWVVAYSLSPTDVDGSAMINPAQFSVGSDERLYIDVLNGVAGDSFSGIVRILELPN